MKKRQASDFLVSTSLYAAQGPGPRKRVLFAIEAPVSDGENASCRVHIRGLHKPSRVHGIDSFQALALSFAQLRHALAALEAEGWRFYFDRDDTQAFDTGLAWFADLQRVPRRADAEALAPPEDASR